MNAHCHCVKINNVLPQKNEVYFVLTCCKKIHRTRIFFNTKEFKKIKFLVGITLFKCLNT
jgi:hypothetical protein